MSAIERAVGAAVERRRAIYFKKREERDPFANDSLTEWEKYEFATEVCRYVLTDVLNAIRKASPARPCQRLLDQDQPPS